MAERWPQSALDPSAGSGAALLHELGIVLYAAGTLIFIGVMVLALMGVFMRGRSIRARRWIVGGGVIFPAITLTALLIYSVAVSNALASVGTARAYQLFLDCFGLGDVSSTAPSDVIRVHVTGKQWWWHVSYEVPGSAQRVVLANELHIPLNRPVLISLASDDVIHSFWAPSLAGKVDMIPGRTTQLRVQTSEAGRYRGQCAEYCGGQHALMAFYIIAEPQPQFDAWLARQQQSVSLPTDPLLRAGYEAFFKGKCHECHAVRGTPADALVGPDLTHVGSRSSLAAGVLNNHVGTMAGWIAGSQDVKPGNAMPADAIYTGRELRAVAAWLESLK